MAVTSEAVRREGRPVDFVNAGRLLSDEEKAVIREALERQGLLSAV